MLQIIQYQKTGEITIEDLPDKKCGEGEILVQNYYSVVSPGTERSSIETASASMLKKAKLRPDLVQQVIDNLKKEGVRATYQKVMSRLDDYKQLGYSSSGIVVESRSGEFQVGDRVACAGFAYHSELISIPKNLAVKVPDNIELQSAAFTTLGAIALQGIRQAKLNLGEKIVVIGLGLIGLITIQLVKANGCRVIGLDISNRNFELAKDLGCDECYLFNENSIKAVENFTNGYGADVVLLTASTNSTEPIKKAVEFSRKKGRIVLVGTAKIEIPRKDFYEKELEFTISCSYGAGRYDYDYEIRGIDYPFAYVRWTQNRNMQAIIDLLSDKKLNFQKLITHKIPIEDGLKAYDLITEKTNKYYVGILIEYNKEIKQKFIYVKASENKLKNESEIKVGFIGAGNFAQLHLLPYLKGLKVNLINVATNTPINAKSVAKRFGFLKYSSNPDEILNDKNINTVFIVTHHSSHGEYVLEALKRGKNIFVEKPLCISEEELNKIRHEYYKQKENKDIKLLVGFNRRFSRQFNIIKNFFSSDKEPFVINYRVNAGYISLEHWVQRREEGGRIIGEGCHFIDIFDFIIQSEPISIHSVGVDTSNILYNNDNVVVTIKYKNGSVANLLYLANGTKSVEKEYCEIFCNKKVARLIDFKKVYLHSDNKVKKYKFNGEKGHKEEVEYFIRLLQNKVSEEIDFESIYNTTLMTIKSSKSISGNSVFRLSDV
ncbi:MAG: bi-domain-containing oxidoreductase [Ignavibacteria bacterium]